jgi:plasmid stabilization system protein ParE
MAKIKIIWSRTAYLQRKIILLYWIENNKSSTYSLKLASEIKKATTQLSKFPYLGKSTDIDTVNCYIIDNYSLYYIHTDNQIQIVSLLDNRQDPKISKLLLSFFEKKS